MPHGGKDGAPSPPSLSLPRSSAAPERQAEVAPNSEGVQTGSCPDSIGDQADNLATYERLYDTLFERIREGLLFDPDVATAGQRSALNLHEENGLLWRGSAL